MELGGKYMQPSTIINLICDNVEDLVVLSAHGYRSVIFRDSTIATLKIIKDDDEEDNLETALDVVATHIKKECSMMDYKHHTSHLQRDRRRICTGHYPAVTKENVHWSTVSSLSPNWTYHHQRHQETPYPIPNRARGVLQQKEDTCMTFTSVVRMMSCCASRNPR